MRLITIGGACVLVALASSTALASAANHNEMAVLTNKGITPTRASEALDLQSQVAAAHLIGGIETALAGDYAGVWFDPAAARFHIGVTSQASRQAAQQAVEQAGITAGVTYTSVRSTWSALAVAQRQWKAKLAALSAHQEARIGLEARRNAVAVTLSVSVPSRQRAALKREAASAAVNVFVRVVPAAQLQVEPAAAKTCTNPFVSKKAYCEETITSGVSIERPPAVTGKGKGKSHKNMTLDGFAEATLLNVVVDDEVTGAGIPAGTEVTAKPNKTSVTISLAATTEEEAEFTFTGKARCSAGPMMVEGNQTYMLTAGHCFGERGPATGTSYKAAVKSEYPNVAGLKEIGDENVWYENKERDIAEVKISAASPFVAPFPNPVPALMAEWVKNPKTPHTVSGLEANVEGQDNCHEGQTSGEECGVVGNLDVEEVGTDHLVEDSACGEGGDSGGPFFMREKTTENVLIQGVVVVAKVTKKCSEGEEDTWYEPMLDLPEAATFGILSTFPGQQLLTTATEIRLPDVHTALAGETYPLNLGGSLTSKNELRSEAGTLVGKEFSILLHFAELTSLGTAVIDFLGVEEPKEKTKCNSVGDSETNGAVLLPNAEFHLVHTNFSPLELGLLILFTKVIIDCNKGLIETAVTGPATARVIVPTPETGKAGDSTSLQVLSRCASTISDTQEITSYYNDTRELVATTLLANIAGTGTKKACELIEGTTLLVPETGSSATMFSVLY